MKQYDQWITDYIEKSELFAKPILIHFRQLVHQACPIVEETKKWSFPNFIYKGEILCGMAAFKKHCSFGFWKASLLTDPDGIIKVKDAGMGNLGKIYSIQDLPSDVILIKYIQEAMKLIDVGAKLPPKPKPERNKEIEVPVYLMAALKENTAALNFFDSSSYSMKREYIEWITDAKTEPTRNKRITTAIEWLAEGKSRNWKYEKC